MTHFYSSLASGTLKCGVNLFPLWLLNLYRCLAFWNFRAGLREVGHISLDTFQAVWERGTHLQQAVEWNIGRKQCSPLKSVSHQLPSTSTPYNIRNAKIPDESSFWACTTNFIVWRSFLKQSLLSWCSESQTFFSLVTSNKLWVSWGSLFSGDLSKHYCHQISGRGSVGNILNTCRWFITQF